MGRGWSDNTALAESGREGSSTVSHRGMLRVFLLVSASVCAGVGVPVSWAAPTGRIFVTLARGHRVDVFEPDGSLLASLPTGISPRGMAALDGKLYVANRGLDRAPGSSITRIDLATLTPEVTLLACEGCAPYSLLFDAKNRLWMSAQAHRAVYRLDPPYTSPAGSVLASWGWPTELASMGDGDLLVGIRGADEVGILDEEGMSIQRLGIGPAPSSVFSRPGKKEGWIATNPMSALHSVSGEGKEYTEEKFVTPGFLGDGVFTPDGRFVLVCSGEAKAILIYDPETGEERGRLVISPAPRRIVMAPDGKYVAVSLDGNAEIAVVDITDLEHPVLETSFTVEGKIGGLLWLGSTQEGKQ